MRIPSGKTDQVIYFVAVDSTDLVTRETGLTTFTVYRSRKGGAATAYTTPTVAELSAANMPGVYSLLVDEDTTVDAASDSEEYVVHITQASMAPVTRTIELYRRDTTTCRTLDVSANGEAGIDWANIGSPTSANNFTNTSMSNVTSVTGSVGSVTGAVGSVSGNVAGSVASVTAAVTLPSIPANWITAAGIAADAIGASELAADAATEIATAVWALATRTLTAGTNIALAKGTGITGFNDLDAAGIRGAVGMTTANFDTQVSAIDTVVDAIKTKTDNLPASPAAVSDIPSAASISSQVWSQVLPGAFGASSAGKIIGDNIDGAITSRFAAASYTAPDNASITAIKAKTDNLPASPAAVGDIPTAAAITDAVWNELTADHTGAGSTGLAVASSSAPTVAEIADGVWDEVLSGHATAGTTGRALGDAGTAGDPWATALPGAYGAGTAGKIIGDSLDAAITSRLAFASYTAPDNATITAIDAKTTNLPAAPAAVGDVPTAASISDAVWNEALADHLGAGSTGAKLNTGGDPWGIEIPGAYGAGTAGKILGDNIDAAVSSRMATFSYTAPDNAGITAIKDKTDNLPAFPAAQGDIPTANTNADALLDRANGIETGYTLRQTMRIMASVLAGRSSGHPGSPVYKDLTNTKTRVSATTNAGNRADVTLDGT